LKQSKAKRVLKYLCNDTANSEHSANALKRRSEIFIVKYKTALATFAMTVLAVPAFGQDRVPFRFSLEGLAVYQEDTDLDNGTSFSKNRFFTRLSTIRPNPDGASFGAVLSLGTFNYAFDDAVSEPWEDIRDVRFSAPVRFRAFETVSVIVSPQVRWDYETGASASDGFTYGLFAGAVWRVSNNLSIGPAFGVFSQLEGSGLDVFPALLIDWDISEKWELTTAAGLGATEGPGLSLNYKFRENMSLSLTARYERLEFRVDDTGAAPGGVGEDESFPVVVSFQYDPSPVFSVSAFAGAEFDGQLTIADADGRRLERQSYDTAPIAGFAVRLRF